MNIGKAIKAELKRQGKTVVWFANQIPCSRTNVYKIFKKYTLDTALLEKISRILNYDFFRDYHPL